MHLPNKPTWAEGCIWLYFSNLKREPQHSTLLSYYKLFPRIKEESYILLEDAFTYPSLEDVVQWTEVEVYC